MGGERRANRGSHTRILGLLRAVEKRAGIGAESRLLAGEKWATEDGEEQKKLRRARAEENCALTIPS